MDAVRSRSDRAEYEVLVAGNNAHAYWLAKAALDSLLVRPGLVWAEAGSTWTSSAADWLGRED